MNHPYFHNCAPTRRVSAAAALKLAFILGALVLGALALGAGPAQAREKFASLVIDAETHTVLHAVDADEVRYPASLTKMMSLYMLFEAMEAGEIGLGDEMRVSRRAARQPPSKIGLRAGTRIRTLDVIKAMVVKSANDAAVVLAERISGSEDQFARDMTRRARELGMEDTRFANASGLPDVKHATTARDMARLGEALMEDFPHYYAFFALRDFQWNGRTYNNHNGVLRLFEGADGLKTGYTRASGYNVVASAERDGTRLIAVVMGGPNSRARDLHAAELLDAAFDSIEDTRPAAPARSSAPDPGAPLAVAFVPPPGSPSLRSAAFTAPAPAPEPAPNPVAVMLRAAAEPDPASALTLAQGDADEVTDTATETGQRGVQIIIEDAPPAPVASANTRPVTHPVTPPAPAPVPASAPAQALAGGWMIQVGAYSSSESAWDRVREIQASRAPGVDAFTPVVEASGGVWRARLTGASRSAADQVCVSLKASGQACFVAAAGS